MTAFHRRTALSGRSSAAATSPRQAPRAPGLGGPAGARGRLAFCCLRQRRDLGPAAPALAIALPGTADLGVLRGIGTEVALDGLASPHEVLVAELGAVIAVVELLRQGPVARLDVHEAGFELDAGRLDLLDRASPRVPCRSRVFLPYTDGVIELLGDLVG